MRRAINLPAIGLAIFLGACASGRASMSRTLLESPSPARRPEQPASPATGGSFLQSAVREGPRVSIRAVVDNAGSSRRVRGVFSAEDDAYVIVGHIDADGVLRIAFPEEPTDNGFVRGNRSYETSEFFAGFSSDFRYRRDAGLSGTSYSPDAYDGAVGYVFIIASWRPMRFDRFERDGRWDSFEVADDRYLRDPRPAIQELASLLVGSGNDYTIQFARFATTEASYAGFGAASSAFYESGYCAGFRPYGFARLPFGRVSVIGPPFYSYGFAYRGSNYWYDAGLDCYRPWSPWGYGFGVRVVQTPVFVTPIRPRPFDVSSHRPPPTPQPPPRHSMPRDAETPRNTQPANQAPEYRPRTEAPENPAPTGPVRRQPRIEAPTPVEHRDRPVMPAEPMSPQRDAPRAEPPQRVDLPRRESPRVEPFARPREPERSAQPRSEPASAASQPERPAAKPSQPERPAAPPAAASRPREEKPVKPPIR